jgi:L-rhamnose mutarotase
MMQLLKKMTDEKSERLVAVKEIMQRAGIRSYSTFLRSRQKLIDFGMFKQGQYKMREADLEKFIIHIAEKHKIIKNSHG